jgi:hypothetical protein
MNIKRIAIKLEKLAMLKFFPSDEGARLGILDLVCKMAQSEEQVDWLVNRMTDGLYNEWPGPAELRACFCSKFRPKDGKSISSGIYLDGIPSESEETNRLILGPNHAQGLIEGRQETRGPMQVGTDPAVSQVGKMRDLSREVNRRRRAATERPTNPNYRPITQAEIDRAVKENRDRRAREELGI